LITFHIGTSRSEKVYHLTRRGRKLLGVLFLHQFWAKQFNRQSYVTSRSAVVQSAVVWTSVCVYVLVVILKRQLRSDRASTAFFRF